MSSQSSTWCTSQHTSRATETPLPSTKKLVATNRASRAVAYLFVIHQTSGTQTTRKGRSYRNIIAGPVDLVECTRVHRPTEEGRRRCQAKNGPKIHTRIWAPRNRIGSKKPVATKPHVQGREGQESRARRRPEISESRTYREREQRDQHGNHPWEDGGARVHKK